MRRTQRKRVTKMVVDTSKTISQYGIQIPKVNYKVIADITMQTAFKGRVTPIPTVLIHYLRTAEFQFISIIMEETIEHGECSLSIKDFNLRMGATNATIYNAKYSLRKMGLIFEERGSDKIIRYSINWNAVNNLERLTVNEPPAIMKLIRKASQKKLIEHLRFMDVKKSYTEKVLPYGHDPREEEMYD